MHSEQPPRFHPNVTARAQSDQKARQERSAAALRENLRKRKQQMRARETQSPRPSRPDGRQSSVVTVRVVRSRSA